MDRFPDESQMERSKDGTEPIRGGSIGLNRILGSLVDASATDAKPRFTAVLLSAFTIFRNVAEMKQFPEIHGLEEDFVRDVNLFLDYFDTYLSHVWRRLPDDRYCPVIVYFPDYKELPKEILRDKTGKRAFLLDLYNIFLKRHGGHDEEVKRLSHSRCFWATAGHASFPHKELVRKFREITAHKHSLYVSGDQIALMTHVLLDYHIAGRLRGINILESYTGRVRKPDEFKFRLDKEGRLPFQAAPHLVVGDNSLIKPMVSPKIKKEILETAEKERWYSRSEGDVLVRIAKISGISTNTLRRYDLT